MPTDRKTAQPAPNERTFAPAAADERAADIPAAAGTPVMEADSRSEPPPSVRMESSEIARLLARALDCLATALPESSPIPQRLKDLRLRLQEERFQLAILGQFKRGKSTFLNALLGQPLLPTGVIPLTAIPTFIAWAPSPVVRVTYRTQHPPDEFQVTGADEVRNCLFKFVTEEANPKNSLGVARVDLLFPAPIVEHGVVLIDTPGIGSTHRHNTDTALAVLSECDAAVFVISADPPITEAELGYLEAIRPTVARLFFILNKADYLEPPDLQLAADFLRTTLQRANASGTNTKLFCVSALRGLRAKQSGDGSALNESGIANVEDYLFRYLAHEKLASLRTAVARKASDLLNEADADLALRVRTLELPAEDLEKRGRLLAEALDRIAGEMRVIRDLLTGDRRRAVEQLEMYSDRLRRTGRRYLTNVLGRALTDASDSNAEAVAQGAIATAIPEYFERELGRTSREFSRTVEEILAGHQQRIDALVNLVRQTAADLFDVPYAKSAASEPFKLGREPYWVTQKWSDRFVALPHGLVNRFLPAKIREARRGADLQRQVEELVSRNVENLRWSTLQGLDDTFRRFAATLEERLASAVGATQGAVEAASARRSDASGRADTELVGLRQMSSMVSELKAQLARFVEPTPGFIVPAS
jgi:GTP-binding protein EngB required for normal cell division